MKPRRWMACAWLLAGALFGMPAMADTFPAKPVSLVVPYPAGGATDVIARLLAEKLSNAWGQPVVVNNRPGAGTLLGAELVARSPGDGYTLYLTTAAHTISASLYKKLNYDPVKDFAPITLTSTIPLVLVVTPSLPVKTLPELIAYARANPGLSFASTGNGTPQHLTGELFKGRNKLQMVHIPYRGDAPMLTDLLGGQVKMAFVTLSAALPHIKSGKLKAIALANPERIGAIADVPTFAQAGMPDFSAATWFGLFAPASLSPALRDKIYQDVARIVATPEVTQKLVEMGGEVNNTPPAQFQAFVQGEAKHWAEAVRLSGAQID
ncbi:MULTISPECIES: Bug family tripartite tricarboxylate transporter substrate binding protein [Cupriavidus]|uniref:Bug family tripartite tricarboxylate transporter substrate binding protein n=1 Tax=Cupriavidus TaxID=106589 RepID=UPI00039EE855|nr:MULTISPECIES: tripartite tricarboxylate transporter substrate binding protein [Cupriavidus]